jgi:mediator of RNA polymerase II transcription subunit 5
LVAILRWTAWTPAVFYSQIFLSAFDCLSQARREHIAPWRAFILGRLPSLLATFEQIVKSETATPESEWNNALQIALMSLLRRTGLLEQCDQKASSCFSKSESSEPSRSLFRELLQQLLRFSLIEQTVAVSMDPSVSNSVVPNLHSEAQDAGLDIKSYLEGQLGMDVTSKDCASWLDRLWQDPTSHNDFVQLIHSVVSPPICLDNLSLTL